jgi:hypothetical protein
MKLGLQKPWHGQVSDCCRDDRPLYVTDTCRLGETRFGLNDLVNGHELELRAKAYNLVEFDGSEALMFGGD